MRIFSSLVLATLVATGAAAAPPEPIRLAQGVTVQEIRPGIWLHVTTDAKGIAANGVVVQTPSGLVLVDTGWTEAQAEHLIAWGRRALKAEFAVAVVTHSHEDRSGGVAVLRRHRIPVGALDLTVGRMRAAGAKALPEVLFTAAGRSTIEPSGFEAYYPGPGHAPDNIVVWFPQQKVLVGGCLVKSARAEAIGYVGDADLASWPLAVAAVRDRYPATLVVPGHGEVGGLEAYARTLELLKAAAVAR